MLLAMITANEIAITSKIKKEGRAEVARKISALNGDKT